MSKHLQIEIRHPISDDVEEQNVDVIIQLESGEKYSATFFSIKNIERLMARYRQTGECGSGLYFWAADMVIIRDFTSEAIRTAVHDLYRSGELKSAFQLIHPTDD